MNGGIASASMSASRPDEADVRQLRAGLAREEAADAGADLVGRERRPDLAHQRRAGAGEGRDPAVGRLDLVAADAGLLLKLAQHRAGKIDGAVGEDVVGIGRAGREIDLAGVCRVVGHAAEDEGAVARPQRREGEAVAARRVREAEVAEGDEARVVGLDIAERQAALGERLPAPDEDAAVEKRRVGAGQPVPMRNDEIAVGFRPGPGLVETMGFERRQRHHHHVRCGGHSRSVPSLTRTAAPPISTDASRPRSMTSWRAMSLGRPIS